MKNGCHFFALKDKKRTALKVFLSGQDVFALLVTGFGKSLNAATHSGSTQGSDMSLMLVPPIGSLEL